MFIISRIPIAVAVRRPADARFRGVHRVLHRRWTLHRHIKYVLFGHHSLNPLVPWIWISLACMVGSHVLSLRPMVHEHLWTLDIASVLAFAGVWIEKGMGLIIPGFVPSPLHEWVEYVPSASEWKIIAGIWVAGLLVYTLLLKVAHPPFPRGVASFAAAAFWTC